MRIDFWGGPRDGDYTYQAYTPPKDYLIPTSKDPAAYLGMPVIEESAHGFISYHRYVLETTKLGNKRYTYVGLDE
jgi:hypothetical protein